MSTGIFTGKGREPSRQEISEALGKAEVLWNDLKEFLKKSYGLDGESVSGGKKFGWCMRYRKARKALIAIYPEKGHFVAQVVLNPAQTEKALQENLSTSTLELINSATPYHDGRWLWIEVKSKRLLNDVFKLLKIKRKPKE